MEAWFSSSEITASSAVRMVSKSPAFASKQAAYKIVSSVHKNSLTFFSRVLCMVWVPHINLTEAIPKPHLSKLSFAALITD